MPNEENVNDESMPSGGDAAPGVQVNAGDSLYIPAGGLQIWNNADGTLGRRLTVAVDPWLPARSWTPIPVKVDTGRSEATRERDNEPRWLVWVNARCRFHIDSPLKLIW